MRGKRQDAVRLLVAVRLIPTHAGKTSHSRLRRYDAGAHPRSRGENEKPRRLPRMRVGSSPLMRGKRQGARVSHDVHGLIPARAGKTSSFSWLLRRSADHPRSREENPYGYSPSAVILGSSPLTRGKPEPDARRHPIHGLIPTHAGKTLSP